MDSWICMQVVDERQGWRRGEVECAVENSFLRSRVEVLGADELSVLDLLSRDADLTQILSPPQKLVRYLANSAPRLAPYPAPQKANRRSCGGDC